MSWQPFLGLVDTLRTSDWINLITALGTWAAAITTFTAVLVALFGEWLKTKFLRLEIEAHNLKGEKNGGSIFYHLKVVNRTPFKLTAGKNCSVFIQKIENWNFESKSFEDIYHAVPYQLCWAPSEETNRLRDIMDEHVLDIGKFDGKVFFPNIYDSHPENFSALVKKGQIVRFYLKVIADNYVSKGLFPITIDNSTSPSLMIAV